MKSQLGSLALLTAVAVSSPASGQSAYSLNAESRGVVIDQNHVDLASDTVRYSRELMRMGSEAHPFVVSLAISSPAAVSTQWSAVDFNAFIVPEAYMTFYGTGDSYPEDGVVLPTGTTYFHAAAAIRSQNADGSYVYRSMGDAGAQLSTQSSNTIPRVHYNRTGDRAEFLYTNTPSIWRGASVAAADKITYADGEVWTYRYNSHTTAGGMVFARPRSIVSSRGYAVQINYSSEIANDADLGPWLTATRITLYNKAYVSCDESLLQECSSVNALTTSVQIAHTGNQFTISGPAAPGTTQQQIKVTLVASSTTEFWDITSIEEVGVLGSGILYAYQDQTDGDGNQFHSLSHAAGPVGSWQYYRYVPNQGQTINTTLRTDQSGNYLSVDGGGHLDELDGIRSVSTGLDISRGYAYSVTQTEPQVFYPDGTSLSRVLDAHPNWWDIRGNWVRRVLSPRSGSSSPQIVQTATYENVCSNPITCNKPITITDARTGVTSYTYSAVHGGVLTETLPADASGINPVRRFSYAQRYARFLSGGSYVASTSPIWVLTEERTCQTSQTVGNSCAAGATDEIATTYDYGPDTGPNNLILRGISRTSAGQTFRTCYGIDEMGRRISATSPNAGLGSCP